MKTTKHKLRFYYYYYYDFFFTRRHALQHGRRGTDCGHRNVPRESIRGVRSCIIQIAVVYVTHTINIFVLTVKFIGRRV